METEKEKRGWSLALIAVLALATPTTWLALAEYRGMIQSAIDVSLTLAGLWAGVWGARRVVDYFMGPVAPAREDELELVIEDDDDGGAGGMTFFAWAGLSVTRPRKSQM